MKVLVAGWFSWDDMGTTAGDVMARDLVCSWLDQISVSYDVASHPLFPHNKSIDWKIAGRNEYTDIVFVCGPFGNGYPVNEMLEYFSGARLIGVDLSLLDTLENWDPFTLLYERDSSRASLPDITFFAPPPTIPVVGLILAHKQKEYSKKSRHEEVDNAIHEFLNSRDIAVVPIDTALLNNEGNLKTAGQIESLIAKMDVVVTTRLHGTVLALKNQVPVIPIDPVFGGAKISVQVNTIGWPVLFNSETMSMDAIHKAFDFCLTNEAKQKARECAENARAKINDVRNRFIFDMANLSKQVKTGVEVLS